MRLRRGKNIPFISHGPGRGGAPALRKGEVRRGKKGWAARKKCRRHPSVDRGVLPEILGRRDAMTGWTSPARAASAPTGDVKTGAGSLAYKRRDLTAGRKSLRHQGVKGNKNMRLS